MQDQQNSMKLQVHPVLHLLCTKMLSPQCSHGRHLPPSQLHPIKHLASQLCMVLKGRKNEIQNQAEAQTTVTNMVEVYRSLSLPNHPCTRREPTFSSTILIGEKVQAVLVVRRERKRDFSLHSYTKSAINYLKTKSPVRKLLR